MKLGFSPFTAMGKSAVSAHISWTFLCAQRITHSDTESKGMETILEIRIFTIYIAFMLDRYVFKWNSLSYIVLNPIWWLFSILVRWSR